jgi:hypothetical protein
MHLDCDQGCHEEKYSETLDHTISVQGSNQVPPQYKRGKYQSWQFSVCDLEIKASSEFVKM